MTETQRGTSKQPPWQRDGDAESVPFGPWLRRHREMREITLREISDSTKISFRYLEALEDERFDLLPAMVFAKGFLRQYARYVGLDPDEVVNRFLVASQGDEPEGEGEPEDEEEARSATASHGTWKYALLVIAAVLVLFVLVFLIPLLVEGEEDRGGGAAPEGVTAPQESASAVPAEDATAETTPGTGVEPGAAPAGATQPPRLDPEAPLRVTLDFREDCWVEAIVDGVRRVSEMRVQGESLQLQAQEAVELRLGNAGVVDVEVNGEPYSLDAAPGEVRRVEIDLSDRPGSREGAAPAGAGDGTEEVRTAGPQP